jgi:hypothetical protein
MLRPTVSRPVCLRISTHLGLPTKYLLLFDNCGSVSVGRSLCREYRSVFYICYWLSPGQSFSVPSPFDRVTIILMSQIWDFPFRRLIRLSGSLLLVDSIVNIFWDPSVSCTIAASIFVTAETAVKIFIPVVTVYYLRVAVWTRFIVWAVVW